MATLDRPRLRPLSASRIDQRGEPFVALEDPMGLAPNPVLIPLQGYLQVVRRFDGRSTLDEIEARFFGEIGRRLPPGELADLVSRLDRIMMLDGPTFTAFRHAYAAQDVRPSAFSGRSYPASGAALGADLARIFAHPAASGPPSDAVADPGRLRGILCPHIDFGRGGPVYTWAYRELIERSDAETFVILGVAHQPCRHRFAMTRKHFETPLGLARTDREFVDRIAESAGTHLFEDELAHRTEHSIEFQVVFLQYLLRDRPEVSIVPILVGSFHDLMESGVDPIDDPEVRRMVDALRWAEQASGKKVAYIGGIDLCHVGPEFGDPGPVDGPTLDRVRAFDRSMLGHATRLDPGGWFGEAAQVGNRWRVCGLAATYTMLHAIGPARGRLLRYDQAVDPARTCCVSFASVAFDAEA
jgi:AmmeMemoRadiSam system protein B